MRNRLVMYAFLVLLLSVALAPLTTAQDEPYPIPDFMPSVVTADVDPLAKKGEAKPVLPEGTVDVCVFSLDSTVNYYIASAFGNDLCKALGGRVVEATPEEVVQYHPMFWL